MHGTENASCEKPSVSPDWLFRIEDMLVAMRRIHEYTTGLSFSEFRSSPMRVEAVLYNFAVLGEAANHAARHARALHPDIEWDELRAMRNIVVHEYSGVRLETVWQTIQVDLPRLVERLERILQSDLG